MTKKQFNRAIKLNDNIEALKNKKTIIETALSNSVLVITSNIRTVSGCIEVFIDDSCIGLRDCLLQLRLAIDTNIKQLEEEFEEL